MRSRWRSWFGRWRGRNDPATRLEPVHHDDPRLLAAQLRLLCEKSPMAAALLDRDMRYLWVSRRWLSEVGSDPGDIVGRCHYDVFPEVPERWREVHRRCLAGATEKADEDQFLRSDGRVDWVRWEVHPWYELDGSVGGIMIFHELINDKKAVELALRKSHEELERRVEERTHESRLAATIVENIAEGVCMVRPVDNTIVYANPKFCGLFGYDDGELVGKPVSILNRPTLETSPSAIAEDIMTLCQRHGTYTFEVQNVRKDGTPFWCRATASWFLHATLGPVVVAVQQDITEEKWAQARALEAERAEQRVRAQLESMSHAGAAISDSIAQLRHAGIEAVLRTIAEQAQLVTGADVVAVGIGDDPEREFEPWVTVGFPPTEPAEERPKPTGVLGAIARGGHSVRLADVRSHPNFRPFPEGHPAVRPFLGVPIRFAGRLLGTLYLANRAAGRPFSAEDQRSIEILAERAGSALETARLYAAETEQRKWLTQVVDEMPDAVVLVDARTGKIRVNRRARSFAALPEDIELRVGDEQMFNLYGPLGERLSRTARPLYRALHAGETVAPTELLLETPAGERHAIVASAAPIHDAAGLRIGAVLVFQDIAAVKDFERQREEWMSVIAHDLRQPVAAIDLSAKLLEKRPSVVAGSREASLVGHIQTAASQLERLIGDLLDVSRIEAKRLSLELRPIDLVPWAREVLHRLEPLYRDNPLILRATLPAAWVHGDAMRLEQVLGNLVSNAAKYGNAGTPIVVNIDAIEGRVRTSVENEGPGFAPEDLPGLFKRFYRASGVVRDGTPGVGLGLYICRGIVEAHSGQIQAQSEPGRKTVFSFELPWAGAGPFETGERTLVERPRLCSV